jgi:hypothetical protein
MFDFHHVLDDNSENQKGKNITIQNGESEDEIVHIKYDKQNEVSIE